MQARFGERARWSVLIGLATAACLVVAPGCKTTKRAEDSKPLVDGIALPELSSKQAEEVGAWVAAAYAGSGGEAPAVLREGQGSAYVALRDRGKLLAEAWGPDGDLANSLSKALASAKAGVPAGASPDTVEIDLAHSFRTVEKPSKKELYRAASGKRTGIRGLELSHGEHTERTAPTKMLAAGEGFKQVVNRFFKQAGVDHDGFAAGGKARVFENQQLLVKLPSGEGIKLLRGNVYVEPREVTQANTQATVDLLIGWMLTHLHEDGRMTYMWLPTISGEKPNDNNMIRQWMATNALIKIAERRDDPQLWARIAKNIDYNLEHFYKQEGEFGTIEFQGKVKLGAVALAAMAIVNHPERARWQTQEHGLRRTVNELWSEDGSFNCFFKPRTNGGKNANVQNFYPGETLLLWAQLYRESRDPELFRRFVTSFRYYRAWHLDPSDPKRRRPSFIPWHTQADFILWEALRSPPADPPAVEPTPEGGEPPVAEAAPKLTPEGWPVGTTPETPVEFAPEELVAFVFEMNDWLIDKMEVWEESAFDDEKGRFYSRETDYGSAHASSTGVYIEGIIDAYEMAKIVGDKPREDRYRKALSRAIRSVMQIQFVDDVDMYYVTDRERTKGGLRTTVIRNEIRVDNVQHVLMGVLKVVDRFAATDYGTD
ncbi:hypothetical protein DB30_06493 [Enhygromyxa salina]|uniref:Uncharacterized protein n=1 Tax=Enhygromyxa salina TaxID=215803 RepID=A0A0C2D3H3_9BACT|nr:hypothetical protein [Enhygromyxa salina]KIG14682.1 hypothetical protein DB30_06493 [Enhygromyxa salina]